MKGTYYKTRMGSFLIGDSVRLIQDKLLRYYRGKVNLIITSPPFPLNNKKKYGNLQGEEYLQWFTSLAPFFSELLTDDGSIVIEIGNSWEAKRPVQSLLHLESLLSFVKHPNAGLKLIQEFIVYNPSRLPSPAQWVTVNRIRTVDSYTHVWWMAKSDFPKADNKKVLRPYSKEMKKLLERQSYNIGKRPSEHVISEKGFLKDQNGSIAHNLLEFDAIDPKREVRLPHNVLSFSNTNSNDYFLNTCREQGITPHPARMSSKLISFFTEFLTDEGDLILDPFAGSNTTGYIAEQKQRKWLSIEIKKDYAEQSLIRFSDPALKCKIKTNI